MKRQSAKLFYEEHLFLYDTKQGFLAAFFFFFLQYVL